MLTQDLDVDILCLTEHWLDQKLTLVKFLGYRIADWYCRPTGKHGGSVIFIKDKSICTKYATISDLSMESVLEISSVFIKSLDLLCICIYRTPTNSCLHFNQFLAKLYDVLNIVFYDNSNIRCILTADFNVDFLCDTNFTRELQNLFTSFGLRLTVKQPTRPSRDGGTGTCIDNIVTNIPDVNSAASVISTVCSDHDALLFDAHLDDVVSSRSRHMHFEYKTVRSLTLSRVVGTILPTLYNFLKCS